MRVCILGAGGLGSVIGGYLAHSGTDVTLIGRAAHMDAIRREGLRVSGRLGDVLVRNNLTPVEAADEASGVFDYLILLVKSKDTASALEGAAILRERAGCVLSLQNDPFRADKLCDWIGASKVMGAVTVEGGTLVAPGHASNHLTADTTAYFGELDGSVSERARVLADAFTRAGLPSAAVRDIQQAVWEKLIQIGCAAGWSVSTLPAIPDLCFFEGLLVREGAEHYVQITRELLSVYKAMGFRPQNYFAPFSRFKEMDAQSFEEAVESTLGVARSMSKRGARSRTSMHEDLLRGRRTESEEIFRPLVDKARELRVSIPTFESVYRVMAVLNRHLKD